METELNKEEENEIKQNRERGASMVEYGILVALIAAVAIVAVGPLGSAIRDQFAGVTAQMPQPPAGN